MICAAGHSVAPILAIVPIGARRRWWPAMSFRDQRVRLRPVRDNHQFGNQTRRPIRVHFDTDPDDIVSRFEVGIDIDETGAVRVAVGGQLHAPAIDIKDDLVVRRQEQFGLVNSGP